MPTKTVALTDEAYDLLREQPKGSHSRFVSEAIIAVCKNDDKQSIHALQMRLGAIEKGLQSCFVTVPRKKSVHGNSKPLPPIRRFRSEKFFEFLETVYLPDDEDAIEWWLS